MGFKLLGVPYIEALEESYLPASLSSDTYPNLIAKGSKVETVGSSLVLFTYNWAPGTERYRKIERFVNAFFSNFDKLRQPPRHPAWRERQLRRDDPRLAAVSRRAEMARPAGRRSRRQSQGAAARRIDATQARAQAAKAAPHDAAEQERLFKEFLEWSRKRPRR